MLSPTLGHRMMGCVLLRSTVTEQAAAAAKKVDQHHLPPPEEVADEAAQQRPQHTVEEASHQHPPHTVSEAAHHHPLHTHCGDCDGLAATDGQGALAVGGFSSSFISSQRIFLPQLLLPSLSYFQTTFPCLPCTTSWFRTRTPVSSAAWSLYPPRPWCSAVERPSAGSW